MPRRATVVKREIKPDPRYQSVNVSRFINKMMMHGKKATAERILYDSFQIIEERLKKNPAEVLEQALSNATPLLRVKSRRVGGATYQVPVEVRAGVGRALAMRWILKTARDRSGRSMAERLAAELIDASQGQGAAVKRREDTHKMADANRAFVHYRW